MEALKRNKKKKILRGKVAKISETLIHGLGTLSMAFRLDRAILQMFLSKISMNATNPILERRPYTRKSNPGA